MILRSIGERARSPSPAVGTRIESPSLNRASWNTYSPSCEVTTSAAGEPWLMKSHSTSPMGPKRSRLVQRRPLKCGNDTIDIEVSLITRSLDRLACKKIETTLRPPITASEQELFRAELPEFCSLVDRLDQSQTFVEPDKLSALSNFVEFEVSLILQSLQRVVQMFLTKEEEIIAKTSEFKADSDDLRSPAPLPLCPRPTLPVVNLHSEESPGPETVASRNEPSRKSSTEMADIPKESMHRPRHARMSQQYKEINMEKNQLPAISNDENEDVSGLPEFALPSLNASATSFPPVPSNIVSHAFDESVSLQPRPTSSSSEVRLSRDSNSFWGQLLRILSEGAGDCVFKLHPHDISGIINESHSYNLTFVGDGLLRLVKPTIVIKEFKAPNPENFTRADPAVRLHNVGATLSLSLLEYEYVQQDVASKPVSQATSRSASRGEHSVLPFTEFDCDHDTVPEVLSPTSNQSMPGIRVPKDKGRSSFDRYGVLYYIGTRFANEEWRNPSLHDHLHVTCSSAWASSDPADICKKDLSYFITQNKVNSWIELELKSGVIIPYSYSFASAHPIYSGYYPRNWELQASQDRKKWVCLKSHCNDTSLTHSCCFGYWRLGSESDREHTYYRYFKIVQTGPNSFGSHELQVSSIELYGRFAHVSEDKLIPATNLPKESEKRWRRNGLLLTLTDPIPEVPVQPKPPKVKAQGKKAKK